MKVEVNAFEASSKLRNALLLGYPLKFGPSANKEGEVTVKSGAHVNRYGYVMEMRELARVQTFGDAHIPPRPFFKDFTREEREKIISRIVSALRIRKQYQSINNRKGALRGFTIYWSPKKAAEKVAGDMRKWLKNGAYYKAKVPNAPKTIEIKQSDVPLIDTERLSEAIIGKEAGE